MSIFGLVLFIVFAAAAVGLLTWNVIYSVKTKEESKLLKIDLKATTLKAVHYAGMFALALTFMFLSIYFWNGIKAQWYEYLFTIFGSLGFGIFGAFSLDSFIIHYYGKNLDPKMDKVVFRLLAASFPLMLVFVFLLTDGFADYVKYPLVNAISFGSGLAHPGEGTSGLTITFYALCIITGALYVYFLCDHKFYVQYGKHGLLESTFLVAFPAGIIGARIFYVMGQWNTEFAQYMGTSDWWRIFAIWEGGLTILGGALTGVIVGVAWFLWRNKGYSIWMAVDIIVPTILIAQAVGRWGNFFNTEVHGVLMDDSLWRWLPTFVFNNSHFGLGSGTAAPDGQLFVPLFFVEGLLNFFGYFVIAHVFGNKFRKFTQLGDLAFGYFIWYGLVRCILEPLRHSMFIMDDLWSWYWSLCFIGIGALCIVVNHLVRYLIAIKKNEFVIKDDTKKRSIVGIIAVVAISAIFIAVGVVLAANSDGKLIIGPSNMNTAVILWVVGCSILICAAIPVMHLVSAIKKEKKVVSE